MKQVTFLLLFLFAVLSLKAEAPKREIRATWLATVYQLDWPKSRVTNTGNTMQIESQKKLMIRILDSLASANMNAVCFQVRSRCDAMYRSSYEPWSSDLVDKRGLDPGYDPLAFVVEEGHKRGIEVHAWINPYRYESVAGSWTGLPGDYRTEHPDWVLTHNGAAILDPGKPEVQQRITDIIREIVSNYNIDGVLFDDYFYLQGTTTQDAATYAEHNPNGLSLEDWRRSNVNKLIANVYNMIQEVKPYVRFGVSPAGIWDVTSSIAASYGVTLPGGISGGYAYNGIYCDPVAWLSEATIDYISPQIYWTIGSSADYSVLSPWWSDIALHFGKHFYSSHSISALSAALKANDRDGLNKAPEQGNAGLSMLEQAIKAENEALETRAFGPSEVTAQIQINRDADKNDAPGSIFYSTSKLYGTTGFINHLKKEKYGCKALLPAIHWKQRPAYSVVNSITRNDRVLSWQHEGDVRYAVYAIPTDKLSDPSVFNSPEYLLGISYTTSFTLPETVDLNAGFAVAVLDRYANEFPPVLMGASAEPAAVPVLSYPADNAEILTPFTFRWNEVANAISYSLEISSDADFSSLISAREVYTNSFSTFNLRPLNQETHYWRVKSKTIGGESQVSAAWKFVPVPFGVTSPANGSEEVAINPTITWTGSGDTSYLLEIATANTFHSTTLVYSKEHVGTSLQIPLGVLVGYNMYYVRVKTKIEGKEVVSGVTSFTTVEQVPDVPVVTAPAKGEHVNTELLNVTWQEEARAKGFRVEVCKSEEFPPRQTLIKSTDNFVFNTTYEGLADDTYYLRVRGEYFARSESGAKLTMYTDWSPVIMFTYQNPTSIADVDGDVDNAYIQSADGNHTLVVNAKNEGVMNAVLISPTGALYQFVYTGEITAGEHTINIPASSLPKGVYLVKVELNGKQQVLRFIK